MNRPRPKNYIAGVAQLSPQDFCNYVNALEEYCTELEKELEQYESNLKYEDDPYKYMSSGEMRMHSWNN